MSSFYGGKEGRTYHIVARYDSVAAMVTQFQKGGAYTEANYGEYVIIDTIKNLNQRSNPQNGLLFRRGFDYNQAAAVKPDVNNYKDQDNKIIKQAWNKAWSDWVAAPGGGAIYVGQIVGSKGDTPEVVPVIWDDSFAQTAVRGDFSKGKEVDSQTGDITYHDTVRIGYEEVKDTDDNTTGAKIAFDIPSTVFEAVPDPNNSPYSEFNVQRVYQDFDPQTEEPVDHPFYYKWQFTIPGGKHGTDIYQMKKEIGQDIQYQKTKDIDLVEGKIYWIKQENEYVQVEEPSVDQLSEYYEQSGILVDGDLNNIQPEDEYITYSVRDYSETAEGDETVHLGRWPYRVIDRFVTNNKVRTFFNWSVGQSESDIVKVPVGTIWNSGQTDADGNLICAVCIHADDVSLSTPPTGPFTVGRQFYAEVDTGKPSIWRVIILPEQAPANSATIEYKAGEDDTIDLMRSIDYVTMDQNGNMFVYYSDSDIPYYLMTSRTLGEVNYDSDRGQIQIRYKGESGVSTKPFYTIKDIVLENSTLKITYAQGGVTNTRTFSFPMLASSEAIKLENQNAITNPDGMYFSYSLQGGSKYPASSPLNLPLAFRRQGDSLLVLYSDPSVRAAIPQGQYYELPWDDPITGTHYNSLKWYNFGPIGSQYHAWGEYTLDQLKTTYANGLSGDREGWLVTTVYPETGQQDSRRYILAYDYTGGTHQLPDGTESQWYEIMSIDQAITSDPLYSVLVSDDDGTGKPTKTSDASKLSINGLWFVTSGGHD